MKSTKQNSSEKILIVENSSGFTGGFKAIFQSVEDLSKDYEFIFVVPKNSKTKMILEGQNFKVYEIKFAYLNRSFKGIIFYLPLLILNAIELRRIVKKEKINLIHSNDLYNLSPVVLRLFISGIPLITHVRILSSSFPKLVYSFWVLFNERVADKIIVVSQVALKPFRDCNKCIVIYNRTPSEEIYPYNYQVKNQDQKVSLICLANFTRGKGQDLVIQAFNIAALKNSTLLLTFAGSDLGLEKNRVYKEELESQVKSLGLEKKVSFKNFITDIEFELKKHQILLNFSESESFSFTVMEALYYGIPCIATNSGGPSEIIENGVTGVLLNEREPELIANEILKLADNETKRKDFSINSRESIRKKFSKEKSIASLRMIYDSLIRKS